MKLSSKGAALIREFEGEKLTAYQCQAGIWTVGIGHTGSDVKRGTAITTALSAAYFKADVVKFERAVLRLARVPLTQNQFDALVSFVFNLGETQVAGSTLFKKLNTGDYAGAAAEFARWRLAGGKVSNGLVKRRAAEAALFLTK